MTSEHDLTDVTRRPPRSGTRREARANQRWRLLEAMAHLVGRRGYQVTSIAQVIARAGVSRKSFYEYFEDKEDCFLQAYEELTDRFIRALVTEGEGVPPAERAGRQLELYLEVLARDLHLARAFIVEVLSAGPRALAMRERVNGRFAELVFAHLTPVKLVRKAITGGVNDVVAGALLAGRKDLPGLLPALEAFLAPFGG